MINCVNTLEPAQSSPNSISVLHPAVKMKWNTNNISLFLQVYQEYPALWNIKHTDYTNKPLKDTLFKKLMSDLEVNQLLGQMDEKQLKTKIKSLKDVYRTELSKVEKSKKSGCGIRDVYVPKLSWFNKASFFSEVMSTRESTSNVDQNYSQNYEKDEEGDNAIHHDEPGIVKNNTADMKKAQFSRVMKPPEALKKRFKKYYPIDKDISHAIHKLDEIANNAGEEKPYDQFGKYVAAELRQLPKRTAILLQQEIQNSISSCKLNLFDNEPIEQEYDNCAIILQSPLSTASVDTSNDEEDT